MIQQEKYKSTKTLFKDLCCSKDGLSNKEAKARLEKYGRNTIIAKKQKIWFIEFIKEFKDLLVIILILASIIAYFFGEKTEAIVIMAIVFLNATIGFIQKYRAEKAIQALKKMLSPHATVLRDGKATSIDATEVVPGDILILNEGDAIAADGRIFEANNLSTQEAIISGESTPVIKVAHEVKKPILTKFQKINNIYMGTEVASGNGKALVTNTGMHTEFGKIAHLTSVTKKDLSPLQKEFKGVGIFVSKITLIISGILILVGVFLQGQTLINSLLFAVSVAVAAVPEGLPATITIALAIGVQKLAKKNAIVKELSSTETLGATTVICSDKTGTLTKNQMTVSQLVTLGTQLHFSGGGYDPTTGHLTINTPQKIITINNENEIAELKKKNSTLFNQLEIISHCLSLPNNASINKENNYKIIGDPTEGALLVATEKIGITTQSIKQQFERLKEIPFSSERKLMTTIDFSKHLNKTFVHTKGAPEQVLQKCSHALINGKKIRLTKTFKNIIVKHNTLMARQALRVLALAYKPTLNQKAYKDENIEKDLIFIGLVGMIDPPRDEVKQAIALTKKAGIKSYIITGDFSLTAAAIAEKLNLIKKVKKQNVITGEELDKIHMDKLSQMLKNKKNNYIFARVSPSHKLKIVSALKNNQEIVSVTGDGVNDAPALKRSDIGVAMGLTGTDVSKEAANMVLADDSFATIVTAIKEGRTIYHNLKKFIYYIFSCNIGELITVFAAIIFKVPMPLTAVLILAVDLGTDVLPALALGIDPPEPDIMKQKPRPIHEKILNKGFIINFMITGLFIGIIVVSGYFYSLYSQGWQWGEELSHKDIIYIKSSTFAFVLLVIIQMFHAFNSRSLKHSISKIGIFNNFYLWSSIIISVLFTICATEIPLLQKYLNTTSLNLADWLIITALASSIIIVDELKKLIINKIK